LCDSYRVPRVYTTAYLSHSTAVLSP